MKKGFTLVELLAVIIIIALLITLTFPSIINFIKSKTKEKDNLTLDLVYNASKLHIQKNINDFPETNGNSYCISLNQLIEEDHLVSPVIIENEDITDTKSVQVSYNNGYKFKVVNTDECIIKQ